MARFLTLATIATLICTIKYIKANATETDTGLKDPIHRKDLVNEAFLEQKDVLLDMLESKLKEVRDKKKKKASDKLNNSLINNVPKCEAQPKDQNLIMKANGISNIGIVNLIMNHGVSGRSHLKLDADGISNVGRAHLEVEMEGGVNVPGISNSLIAVPPRLNNIFCDNQETPNATTDLNIPHAESHIEAGDLDGRSLRKTDINNATSDGIDTKINDVKISDDIEIRTNLTASTHNYSLGTSDLNTTTTVSISSTTAQSNLNTVT